MANNATFDLYKSLISKFQSLPPLQSYVRDETIDFLSKADVALESFNSVFAYLKPYRGLETKTLYYDEREWRYVVPARPEGNKTPVIAAFVNDIEKVTAEAKRILWEEKDRWLSFEHSDIKYIIVKDDSDIGDVLKHLDEINQRQPGRYDKKAVDRLTSRILTYEQIQEDF